MASQITQRGRTLIELLIAMAIGFVIVVGVSSLYISSSGISRTANQLSTVEQAGHLALLIIGDSLKTGAYGEIVGSDFVAQGQTLMDGVHLAGCTGSQFADPFPLYVAVPGVQTLPDLSCTAASGGDALYVRYQAGPIVAEMTPAEAARIRQLDCTASVLNQDQVLDAQQYRAGSGLVRPIVTNVFVRDPFNNTLDCRGYGGGAYQTLLRDVIDFKVFYRFDDVARAAGAFGDTNAAPFGGSIRDATYINGLPNTPVDPWNYVVAVMVCITIQTGELGLSVDPAATGARCPVDAAEAESGLSLTAPIAGGRIPRTFSQVFAVRARATASPSIF